jgi:hypothetical protein
MLSETYEHGTYILLKYLKMHWSYLTSIDMDIEREKTPAVPMR